jgi:hypothetical protein
VPQGLVTLLLCHDGLALVAEGDVVVAAPDEQVRVGEPEKGVACSDPGAEWCN